MPYCNIKQGLFSMNNAIIARKLLTLAKSLVADDSKKQHMNQLKEVSQKKQSLNPKLERTLSSFSSILNKKGISLPSTMKNMKVGELVRILDAIMGGAAAEEPTNE